MTFNINLFMASEDHESPVLNQEANKKPFQKEVPDMDL